MRLVQAKAPIMSSSVSSFTNKFKALSTASQPQVKRKRLHARGVHVRSQKKVQYMVISFSRIALREICEKKEWKFTLVCIRMHSGMTRM